ALAYIEITARRCGFGWWRVGFHSQGRCSMKVRMLVLLAVGSVLAAGAAVQGQGKADADKIQGTWTLVSMEKAGKKMPDDELKGAKLTFTTDAIKVRFGGKEEPDVSYK